MTVEYLHGARHRFLPPFRVFLLCNLLYFVAVDRLHLTVLTAPLARAGRSDGHTRAQLARHAREALSTDGRSERSRGGARFIKNTITAKYDGATEGIAKLIVVVLIPFYAVIFQLMFVGTKRFFAEHLVFSTHFVSFFLLGIPLPD